MAEESAPGGLALHALALLADPARRPVDASRWAIVVAHPDDETLGIGSQLHRLHGIRLILVTDGAPRRGDDFRRRGFASPSAYAAARRDELRAALAAGGAEQLVVQELGIPDQEAALDLPGLARTLAERLGDTDVVLTHAYEGGHPDHDAVAFGVHEVTAANGAGKLGVVEMPFYRAGADGSFVAQDFEPVPGHLPVHLVLAPEEVARKQAMLAAHRSQAEVLAPFDAGTERFREAPAHDFGRPPQPWPPWYERFDWGIDWRRWQALVETARRALDGGTP